MINLQQIIKIINSNRDIREIGEIDVDIKSYVRIKRDINQLNRIQFMPYSRCVDDWERFCWHQHRALMKAAPVCVMGVLIKRKT